MADEKNAGTFVEVDGQVGGPQTTTKREKEMRAEVLENDPLDKEGPGPNMAPAVDNGTTYMYYRRDMENPDRPEGGPGTDDVALGADAPVSKVARGTAAAAAAGRVADDAAQVPPLDSAYDMAATISSIEDAERTFQAYSTESMEGATFTRNLIFSGSTTFAPLMQALVEGFQQRYGMWRNVHPSLPMAKIDITVRPCGTPQGIADVLDREADFAMVSFDEPYSTFQKFGEFREAFEVAHGIMAIVVNANNNLSVDKLGGLSRDDYRRVFSGHAATWDEIDAALPQEPVNVYVARDESGMARVFDAGIMKGTAISEKADISDDARDLALKIAKDPWGIGYAPLRDVLAVNREAFELEALKVDGNEPDAVTTAANRYPLVQPFLLLTSRRADPFVHVFLEYVYSQQGYDIVKAQGYLPSFKPGFTKQVYVSRPTPES